MANSPALFLLLYDALILFGAIRGRRGLQTGPALLSILFFCSGMPALIYQIVWQRALFAIYGVNSESVAVVVSAFMIGLGLGSLVGGWLSAKFPRRVILFFALAEFGTAAFGLASLAIFQRVAQWTAGAPLASLVPLSLALLFIPTACMGATLPLLADYLVRAYRPVGYSVGSLYFSNTFGSAVACYLCAIFLLRDFGQRGSVRLAAFMNLAVGVSAFLFLLRRIEPAADLPQQVSPPYRTAWISLKGAMALSALTGCISLGFEIVWFRVFVLASSDRAPAFALLLSTFLAGVAAGAYIAGKLTENKTPSELATAIAAVLIAAGGLSHYLPPIVGFLNSKGMNYLLAASGFFLTAALLGAVFPLLCRLAIPAGDKAGRAVSFIYVANIAGSATGSLLIGFVLFNYIGLRGISSLLAISSLILGVVVLAFASRGRLFFTLRNAALVGLPAVAFLAAQLSYGRFYEHLVLGAESQSASASVAHIAENRNGIVAVLDNGAVFGNGVYDGFFNIDPLNDKNLIVRAFAVPAFNSSPVHLLMVGLSSGSWAQVLANEPAVQSLDIVEINPGYLPLIRQYPAVRSLLSNPKVHIYIDDGRRWLFAHPGLRYDLIV